MTFFRQSHGKEIEQMELAAIVRDIHRLNHQLERLERKYGIMSETFYESYTAGEEPEDDAWVLEFEKWAGLYEVWLDRQGAYRQVMQRIREEEPSLFKVIQPAAA
jgi:hypothetical protein